MCVRGKFIIFEGADGAGTTTQAQLLFDFLHSKFPSTRVVLTSEPSAHPIGHFIRQLLKSKAADLAPLEMAMLFFADRGDHYRSTIIPALDNGQWVICDRNWQSTLVYQGLIHNSPDLINQVLRMKDALTLPPADVCFILDVPFALAKTRRGKRQEADVYETVHIQQRVVAAYRNIPQYDSTAWLVDCQDKAATDIHRKLLERISPHLPL